MRSADGPARLLRRSTLGAAAFACLLTSRAAFAEDEPATNEVEDRVTSVDPFAQKPGLVGLLGTAFVGSGLRFNDPFRLATPLGSDAESVSRTATYLDLGLGATLFGRALGLRHGPALRASFALEGVSQAVLTPSYLAYARRGALAAWGRAGVPLVVSPDVTWGLEAAAGGAFYVSGGIGLAAEIVGDVFYGAGTAEVRSATYPILAGQAGIVISYEVLP